MARPLTDNQGRSIVQRFITSGKPGFCELCKKRVEKLEAHHIKYAPEVTIKLCHDCHHKCHFWPLRLSQFEKYKLLSKLFTRSSAENMSRFEFEDPADLAKIIAPSRKEFIHKVQRLHETLRKKAPEKSPTRKRKMRNLHEKPKGKSI